MWAVGTPSFRHGTWTLDGHLVQVFADEANACHHHEDMPADGFTEREDVWDVAEVGAESGY